MTNKFKTNLQIGFGISLFLLMVSSTASYISIKDLVKNYDWVNHTNAVNLALDQTLSTLINAETGMRGYILANDDVYLDPYKKAPERAIALIDEVSTLTSDNGLQRVYVRELRKLVDTEIAILSANVENNRRFGHVSKDSIALGKFYMDKIRAKIKSMKNVETRLLEIRSTGVNKMTVFTLILIVIASVLSIVISIYYYFKIRKNISQIDLIRAQLERKKSETERQIKIVNEYAEKVASGDFKARISEDDLKT